MQAISIFYILNIMDVRNYLLDSRLLLNVKKKLRKNSRKLIKQYLILILSDFGIIIQHITSIKNIHTNHEST